VAAGVAVQSQYYDPFKDARGTLYYYLQNWFFEGYYGNGLGICGVSDAQMNTPLGDKILYPDGTKKGVGLGLAGQDQTQPAVAVAAMRNRITTSTDKCTNCSSTDIFIAAGVAQNSDLTPAIMQLWTPGKLRLHPSDPNGITIKWADFFNGADHHVRFQLKLFSNDAKELQNRGWYVPGIAWVEINTLTTGAYR